MDISTNPDHWQFFHSVVDGEVLIIDGINVWDHQWIDLRLTLTIKDPIYGQTHAFSIYEITGPETTIRFAAGEFSNLIWGFYLPVARR